MGVISHKQFVKDLARGAIGEEITEEFFLEEFGLCCKNVSENNPDYDLIINSLDKTMLGQKVIPGKLIKKIFKDSFGFTNKKELTVEVKYDEAAAKYKNLFIEIFFNIDNGSPGTTFKCKADLITWVIPVKKKVYKIYLFKRAEFLAWLFHQIMLSKKKMQFKIPQVSRYARGIPVPIALAIQSQACIGEFNFKIK